MTTFDEELKQDAAIQKPFTSDAQLSELRQMGEVLLNLEENILKTADRLEDLKRQRQELSMRTIPDLMDLAGIDKIGLAGTGTEMIVKPYYHANIPEENATEASTWLDEHGHGDLMRTVVSVDFGPGEHEHATNVVTLINSYFRGRNDIQREPVIKNAVHWKTLTSFVKEQLEAGELLPLEVLGAKVGRQAKIAKRKGK